MVMWFFLSSKLQKHSAHCLQKRKKMDSTQDTAQSLKPQRVLCAKLVIKLAYSSQNSDYRRCVKVDCTSNFKLNKILGSFSCKISRNKSLPTKDKLFTVLGGSVEGVGAVDLHTKSLVQSQSMCKGNKHVYNAITNGQQLLHSNVENIYWEHSENLHWLFLLLLWFTPRRFCFSGPNEKKTPVVCWETRNICEDTEASLLPQMALKLGALLTLC